MGEKENQPFQLSFNPSLKVDFQGSRVTSDSGLLLVRELDERPGLSSLLAEHLTGDRRGKNIQLPLPDLLRQSIYSRLAGYEDVNDAERLSQDPTFRLIGSEKIWDRGCDSDSGERQRGVRHRGTADAPGGAAQSQTHRVVQGLSLSGSQLEDGTTGGGEGGVPCWGVIPASGVHRDPTWRHRAGR